MQVSRTGHFDTLNLDYLGVLHMHQAIRKTRNRTGKLDLLCIFLRDQSLPSFDTVIDRSAPWGRLFITVLLDGIAHECVEGKQRSKGRWFFFLRPDWKSSPGQTYIDKPRSANGLYSALSLVSSCP